MFHKLTQALVFLTVSSSCFATDIDDWQCSKPTHTKGSAWNPNGHNWHVIADAPDSEQTEVSSDADVKREYQRGWANYNSIQCTFPLKNSQQLVMEKKISCAFDKTYNDWSFGFRWSSGICTTKAGTPENCKLSMCSYTGILGVT
jgi:hypothetical protein